MPVVESSVVVPVDPATAFAVSQTTGDVRLRGFSPAPGRDVGHPDPAATRAVRRYGFTCRPAWLAPVAERVGSWLLGRDVRRRIDGFARGCADPVVVAAARGPASPPSPDPGRTPSGRTAPAPGASLPDT
ncbi:hypothetical protein [Oerskovia paurometabola]|uniref:hypothetical protein n=1 Tax=Oerskovia paurometabola TaxID=162170 RepID=UPI00382D8E80